MNQLRIVQYAIVLQSLSVRLLQIVIQQMNVFVADIFAVQK
jgi:hypothetical protein